MLKEPTFLEDDGTWVDKDEERLGGCPPRRFLLLVVVVEIGRHQKSKSKSKTKKKTKTMMMKMNTKS